MNEQENELIKLLSDHFKIKVESNDWLYAVWAALKIEKQNGWIDEEGISNLHKLEKYPFFDQAVFAKAYDDLRKRVSWYRSMGITAEILFKRIDDVISQFRLIGYHENYAGMEGSIRLLLWRACNIPWGINITSRDLKNEKANLVAAYYLAFTDYAIHGRHWMDGDQPIDSQEWMVSSTDSSQQRFEPTQAGRIAATPEVDDKGFIEVTSILFLAADPTDASRLRLGEEFREIHEKLKLAQLRDHFKLKLPQLSVRPADISQALLDVQPRIVHFSGHGTSTGELCFESPSGQTHLVQPDALAALFQQFANQIDCVLLNACYSETQAKAVAEHIQYVIGMNQAVGDKAAIAFAVGFYQALGAGRTIDEAYKLGCVQIRLQGIPEHLTPVLIKKGQMQS